METGTIVEFIDRKKILCGVVLQTKKQKVRLLTESNREEIISENRLFCHNGRLDPALGRDRMVSLLLMIGKNREELKKKINVLELWDVLNAESEWVDVKTMAELAWGRAPDPDGVSAVIRALFDDRVHFKFDVTRFFPNPPEVVEQITALLERQARRQMLVEEGAAWVRHVLAQEAPLVPPDKQNIIEILKSHYLFEKDGQDLDLAREILARAGVDAEYGLFSLLVRLGVWGPDVNIDVLRLEVPDAFPQKILDQAQAMVRSPGSFSEPCERRDLTSLPLITIDGQASLDFDDAISLEEDGEGFRIGVHISDVAHFVRREDSFDAEARSRGSSIYMPDQKIPMLPQVLAEGLFSLKAGEVRPAVSVMIALDKEARLRSYEVCTSLIRVQRRLSYHDANLMADADKEIIALCAVAEKLREKRLDEGALILSLPEINIWVAENGEVTLHKVNRESGSRTAVSELMILANTLMADFLSKHGRPGVFRTQPDPKNRLFERDQGTLFSNWMQRRHLSRFILYPRPERHSGVGANAYITATSPIRKYLDLVNQRQIRSVLDIEPPYSEREIEEEIMALEQPMARVMRLQVERYKYWIYKYLEKRIGQHEDALVLDRRRDRYVLLLTDYMMECSLPAAGLPALLPEDRVTLSVQEADARRQTLSFSLVSVGASGDQTA